jgi:hypothetical protein
LVIWEIDRQALAADDISPKKSLSVEKKERLVLIGARIDSREVRPNPK